MRAVQSPTHRDAADRACQLNRRNNDSALANAHGDGFPRVPLLAEGSVLPFLGRHYAADFARQIDPGLLSKPKGCRPLGDLADSQPLGERVEKHVTRLVDPLGNIHRSVRAMFREHPAFESTPVEDRAAAAVHVQVLGNTFLQSGHGHDDLEHRARRQLRLNGFVQQGVVRIVGQLVPFVARDAHGKIVGIKRWPANHGQHFAVARVHGHDGAVLSFQRLLRRFLEVDINRQLELLPGYSGDVRVLGSSHFFAFAVDQHLARAVAAFEQVVILRFHSTFADDVAALVGIELA